MSSEDPKETGCKRCGKPKSEWEGSGVEAEDGAYCCEGCLKDTGCTCKHNQYDFDNSDTRSRNRP